MDRSTSVDYDGEKVKLRHDGTESWIVLSKRLSMDGQQKMLAQQGLDDIMLHFS